MRILIVTDKKGSAIHRISEQKAKATPWHSFRIVDVHPKRPSADQLDAFEKALQWCDVIDFEYWKTGEKLHALYDIKKPSLLVHHNPYDINRSLWTEYKINVVMNHTQQREIKAESIHIPHPIDLDFWGAEELQAEKKYDIIMVANRIEGKKGILPVAKVAKKLGLKMCLVGDISDPTYYEEVIDTGVVEFFHKIPDEALRDLYHESKMHICNSVDNYESGTLPILEAMAAGTPVLTRKIGHVPETSNGRNMMIRPGQPEDLEEVEKYIKTMLELDTRKDMIQSARESIKYRNYDIYAREFSKLYHKLLQEKDLVTAIIPTTADPEELKPTLTAVMSQDYGPMEIIVVHDGQYEDVESCEQVIEQLRPETYHSIKFYQVTSWANENGEFKKTYGLARARNKAIVEAEGKWLWFVDDRMVPATNALTEFFNRKQDEVWLWGVKDSFKKSFVENFSFVKRDDVIKCGMFNEQITQYGGMTQDIRTRAERHHKMKLQMVESAEATTARKSGSKWKRNSDIAKSKTQCYKLYG